MVASLAGAALIAPATALAVGSQSSAATSTKTAASAAGTNDNQQAWGSTKDDAQTTRNASDRQQADVRRMRVSKLIGKDVRNSQGEDLGDIKDLVVDVNNGKVHYVVLSFGGFLGLGDKLFAFPTRAFDPAHDKDELVLRVDKQKLENAPGFESSAYPDWNSPNYRNQVDKYFGSDMAMPSPDDMRLVRATDLIGQDVNDPAGKDLGEINDIVVNMNNGDVRYAVLEFDKSWSLDNKLFAFPLTKFDREPQGDELVLDISKQALASVPGFDENNWPNVNDPRWVADVDRYLVATAAVPLPSAANDAIFRRLDRNDDGALTHQEARADDSIEQGWNKMDSDRNGRVTRNEFDTMYRR
jgi:sporulation protein YlmC with PRC-barrel domain